MTFKQFTDSWWLWAFVVAAIMVRACLIHLGLDQLVHAGLLWTHGCFASSFNPTGRGRFKPLQTPMKSPYRKLGAGFHTIAPSFLVAQSYVVLFACLFALTAKASAGPDIELKRLTSKLEAAMTQAEMNIASGKLAEFWEQRLKAIEQKIEAKLNKKERKEFAKSRERWRSYRTGEVTFRASFFEGGSIQPLIANTAYYEITEHRVSDLESLFAAALSGRAELTAPTAAKQPIRASTNLKTSATR